MPEASIVIKATDRFSDAMKTMRDDLADDLVIMGVDVSADEPLQTLVPKVLRILQGGGLYGRTWGEWEAACPTWGDWENVPKPPVQSRT